MLRAYRDDIHSEALDEQIELTLTVIAIARLQYDPGFHHRGCGDTAGGCGLQSGN